MKIVKTEATRKQNRVKSTPPKEGSKKLFLFISVRLPVKEVLLKSLWKKSRGKIKSLTTKQAAAKMWQKRARKWKFRPNSVRREKNTPKFSEEIVLFVAKTTRQTSRSVEEPLFDTVKLRFEDLFFFLFFFWRNRHCCLPSPRRIENSSRIKLSTKFRCRVG